MTVEEDEKMLTIYDDHILLHLNGDLVKYYPEKKIYFPTCRCCKHSDGSICRYDFADGIEETGCCTGFEHYECD